MIFSIIVCIVRLVSAETKQMTQRRIEKMGRDKNER